MISRARFAKPPNGASDSGEREMPGDAADIPEARRISTVSVSESILIEKGPGLVDGFFGGRNKFRLI
jgi:hypothetical protein